MTTTRQEFANALAPLLPDGWRLVRHERNLDAFTQPVVMLKQSVITKTPVAPQGALDTTYTVTIAAPELDPVKAEDTLDDGVLELLFALQQVPGVRWTTATKVLFQDAYMAYDIDLTVTTRKEA